MSVTNDLIAVLRAAAAPDVPGSRRRPRRVRRRPSRRMA